MSNYVLELAAYNPPKAVENRQDNWVKFGEKNDYYQFLIDRYNNSTTNNQVINNIVKLIYGKGLDARDANRKPNEFAQMKMLFSKEVTKKAITDMYLLGQCALQVIYAKNKKTIVEVQHIPMHLLRPEKCNKDGIIENYYYSDNWDKLRDFPPTIIPSFGNGNKTLEILVIGNYTVGQKYFSNVSYLGGLAYCKLEEDIAEYYISLIETGFSTFKIVNFNNGVPDEDMQGKINASVISKTTGASGMKVLTSFNSDETKKTTVDSIPIDNAAAQYEYLSNEARDKILLSHGVTSGLLFGVNSANGFSSNADELKTAFILFDNNVVIPNQEQFCDGIDKILAFNKVSLDLTFISLKSLDDTTDVSTSQQGDKVVSAVNSMSPLVANKVLESMTPDEIRSLIGLPPTAGGALLSPVAPSNFSEENHGHFDIDSVNGEIVTEEWELVSKREYLDENEPIEEWANKNIKAKKNLFEKFAEVIKSYPSKQSYLDKDIYKVRYEYAERYSKPNSREFCMSMMKRTNSGVVYRKEDIDMASFQGLNKEFGHKGQSYSLFKYKGGVACSHYWNENLYRLKSKTDKSLSSSEEVDSIAGYNPKPAGLTESKIAPIDMPNIGHHPNYGK